MLDGGSGVYKQHPHPQVYIKSALWASLFPSSRLTSSDNKPMAPMMESFDYTSTAGPDSMDAGLLNETFVRHIQATDFMGIPHDTNPFPTSSLSGIDATAFGLPTPRRNLTESDWDERKPTIKKMYIDDGKTLKEVMDIMKREFGLCAT